MIKINFGKWVLFASIVAVMLSGCTRTLEIRDESLLPPKDCKLTVLDERPLPQIVSYSQINWYETNPTIAEALYENLCNDDALKNENIKVTINDIILRYVATVGTPNNYFTSIYTSISQPSRQEITLMIVSLYQSRDIIMWRVTENSIKQMIRDYRPALVKKLMEAQTK